MQARWHLENGYSPVTPAAYELSGEQGFYTREPEAEIAVVQLLGRTPTASSREVRPGRFVEVRDVIESALESVWVGSVLPRDALGSAVRLGNDLLREIERP